MLKGRQMLRKLEAAFT